MQNSADRLISVLRQADTSCSRRRHKRPRTRNRSRDTKSHFEPSEHEHCLTNSRKFSFSRRRFQAPTTHIRHSISMLASTAAIVCNTMDSLTVPASVFLVSVTSLNSLIYIHEWKVTRIKNRPKINRYNLTKSCQFCTKAPPFSLGKWANLTVELFWKAAADLGMFSMFGRTGAPTKGGPTKGAANFLHARNTEIMGNPRVNNESNEQKQVVVSFSGELTADTRTVMTTKGRQFFPVEGPHIFFRTGPRWG